MAKRQEAERETPPEPEDTGTFCICSCRHTRTEITRLRATVQEREAELADLRPGGRFAWKSKCEELEREVARLLKAGECATVDELVNELETQS